MEDGDNFAELIEVGVDLFEISGGNLPTILVRIEDVLEHAESLG